MTDHEPVTIRLESKSTELWRLAGAPSKRIAADQRNPYRCIRKDPTSEHSAAEQKGRAAGRELVGFDAMCSILLVEDHLDTRRAFAAILRSWGHIVSTSDCVAGGLRFLDDNAVDVVLSDIGLPDRNGYDFIAEARQRTPNMTAIAVSAYFTAADQQRGHDAGFDMCFAKPVDLTTLERVLERMNSATAFNGNGAAAPG
jgi:CheY-like chemotaxis protein